MTRLSNRKEGVMTGIMKGTHLGFLLAVLLMFSAMLMFTPGSSTSSAPSRSARPFMPAPEEQDPCNPQTPPPDGCLFGADIPTRNFSRAGAENQSFSLVLKGGGGGGNQCILDSTQFDTSTTDNAWIRAEPIAVDRIVEIKYSIRPNNGRPRSGRIQVVRVGDGRVVACHEVFQTGCEYLVEPEESDLLPDDKTNGQFTVKTTPADDFAVPCDFKATSSTGEITVDGGEDFSNTGNPGTKTITYKVAENKTTDERPVGTITVSERTGGVAGVRVGSHRVRQKGKPTADGGCTYSLSAPGANFQASGGNGSFQVRSPDTCNWTAISDKTWIKLLDDQNFVRNEITGRGTGNVKFRVDETDSFRSDGSITILDAQGQPVRTFEIFQFGRTVDPGNPCSAIPILPQSAPSEFSADGGEGSFELEASPGCRWTAKPDKPWIKVKDAEGNTKDEIGGTGRRTISYVVDKNNDRDDSEQGSIEIRNGVGDLVNRHTLSQKGKDIKPTKCEFTISPPEAFVGEGGGTFLFTVMEGPGSECELSAESLDTDLIPKVSKDLSTKNVWTYNVSPWINADKKQQIGRIKIGDKIYNVTQFSGGGETQKQEGECPSNKVKLNSIINGTLSRVDKRADCINNDKNAFLVDKYELRLTEKTRVAINVAAVDFDPTITLIVNNKKFDDDGGGFRNARLPRLPRKDAYISLGPEEKDKGTEVVYTIEISSFNFGVIGDYALYISSDKEPSKPVILGAAIEGETLLVIGENFEKQPELFIGDSTVSESNTKNARDRTRTALVALRSGTKVKSKAPIILRVVNKKSGNESPRFIFPKKEN
jgi:hypothetical protein